MSEGTATRGGFRTSAVLGRGHRWAATASSACGSAWRCSAACWRRVPTRATVSGSARACRSRSMPEDRPGDRPMTIEVIVADDQPLMRAAIGACLDAEPAMTVVGEAGDGDTAVRLAEQLRPDVVVMDVRMPGLSGIEATRRIVGLTGGPPIRVLVMTTFDVDEHIIDGLRAGASGFLVKDATPDELLGAVRVIAGGQAQLSPSVTRRLLDLHGASLPRDDERAGDPVA